MKICAMILLLATAGLSGCGNLSLDGLTATGTSTVAAAVGTAVAGPAVGVPLGVAAGVMTDAITKPPETTVDVLEALPTEERLDALKHQHIWEAIEHLGLYAIGGLLLFFLLPFFVGLFIRKPGDRKIVKQAFNHSNITI